MRRACLLAALVATTTVATAQTPPRPAQAAQYSGLHAAAWQGDAARMGEFERRLGIVVDEHLFDCSLYRRMIGDHRGEHGVEMR